MSDLHERVQRVEQRLSGHSRRIATLEQWRIGHEVEFVSLREKLELLHEIAADVRRAKRVIYGIGGVMGLVGAGILGEFGKWAFHAWWPF